MSRKSENSAAGSAGDGESAISSYETSPREITDPGATGPFGDNCVGKSGTSVIIHKIGNTVSSTDSEDLESCELKMEYFQRLDLIRQKLASIDIANKSYYKNCFTSSPNSDNQCLITEIIDDNPNTDDTVNININRPSTSEMNVKRNDTSKELKMDNPETVDIINNNNYRLSTGQVTYNPCEAIKAVQIEYKSLLEMSEKYETTELAGNKCHTLTDCSHFKSQSVFNFDVQDNADPAIDTPIDNLKKYDMENASRMEIKTIFDYANCCNAESSIELLDLNYNPPKKKYCLREKTPTMAKTEEGFTSSSAHVKMGADSYVLNNAVLENKKQLYEDTSYLEPRKYTKNEHIFPKVQLMSNDYLDEIKTVEHQENVTDKDDFYVLFLDTLDQSQTGSPKSHRTITTDSSGTVQSLAHTPKKKRILMRSARNKVKPVDNITLWEEIRTLEAINKRNLPESSSSKESYFQKVIINKNDSEPQIDLVSVGGLDVPRKVSLTTRFPSITKITKYCPFVSNKKSQIHINNKSDEVFIALKQNKLDQDQHVTEHQEKEHIPGVANTLLHMKREQDLYFENDQVTLSGEEHSEYSYSDPEDDIDAYYEPYCLFCFCFYRQS